MYATINSIYLRLNSTIELNTEIRLINVLIVRIYQLVILMGIRKTFELKRMNVTM